MISEAQRTQAIKDRAARFFDIYMGGLAIATITFGIMLLGLIMGQAGIGPMSMLIAGGILMVVGLLVALFFTPPWSAFLPKPEVSDAD